jgi:dTDP-4-dehydrorhamnose reductase
MLVRSGADLLEGIRERRGIYHLSCKGHTSRYEWAKQILANDPDRTGQLVEAIEPALSGEFPTPATRPLFTALDCTRFETTFGLQLPDWSNTLKLAMTG